MRPAVKAPRRPGAPPGRRTRPGKAAWAGLLLLAAAMPAGARVFQFGGRGDTDPVRAVSAAEHPVYQTTLQLNGGSGAVDVRACPGSVSAVLERLMGAYREQGALAFGLSGEQLGWGVVLYNVRVIRLLAA
ncbi:MAG: hypothetical protein NTV49_05500 [Kiritimatiellaeota bacterium]|nr:hypothetical protein [Kiritimatiellota bacterium]